MDDAPRHRHRRQIAILDHPSRTPEHLPTLFWFGSDDVPPQPATRPFVYLNVTKHTISPSRPMVQHLERRAQDGQRLFNTSSDELCDVQGFSNKENLMMDGMVDFVSQGPYSVWTNQSDQQESCFNPNCNALRDTPESSTITIDNVKSKLHGTSHDGVALWCFGVMAILAFAMMTFLGGPASIERWSASGTIVRLVFILGTQPLWKHRPSMNPRRNLEGTTNERAVGSFLREREPPIHQTSSRRAFSTSRSQ